MKCLSRSTWGIVIGGLQVILFSIIIIYIIVVLNEVSKLSETDEFKNEAVLEFSTTILIVLLIICFVAAIVSGFLIYGIIKKRHSLMKPWIYSAIASLCLHIFRIIIHAFSSSSFGGFLATIFLGAFELGIQCLVVYPIYTLYKDLRDGNAEQEQTGFSSNQQNPPSYGEVEKGGDTYN